jgi:SnoaL-like domain
MQRDETQDGTGAPAVAAIRSAVEKWAVWRDAGYWDRFATLWHPDGYMSATWFQGSAEEFIAVTKAGFDDGVRILHFLGGTTVDVSGSRAIAQTKMTISQRSVVHGEPCDVVCTGRFYDFFAEDEGEWKLVRRQPIYEKDRLDPVRSDARISLDADRLAAWPEGYRHLAYLQEEAGFTVKDDLPGLTGAAVEHLYSEGAAWLAGAEGPWSQK